MTLSRDWLENQLTENRACAYLRRFGSPLTLEAFRERLPLVCHDDLTEYLQRIRAGEADVLFAGRPVACEYTSGTRGARKWIVYSAAGLNDFRRTLSPWLTGILHRYSIKGSIYLSTSPARAPGDVGGIPLGVPDSAYLDDDLASFILNHAAVPVSVGQMTDLEEWRRHTLTYLRAAGDLEMISVWSPVFLLRLLDDLPDPLTIWPRLKFVSCWTSAASRPYAEELARRLPVKIQGKGLLSTEAVVTVPDSDGQSVLVSEGFTEFLDDGGIWLAEEICADREYEVVVTTASGFYRYRTGDLVRMSARQATGAPVLEFVGRTATQDLVGEKISEPFAAYCLHRTLGDQWGFAALVADGRLPGYWLLASAALPDVMLSVLEELLSENPHYAYARRLGQLRPLAMRVMPNVLRHLEEAHCRCGGRLGDFKPRPLYGWEDLGISSKKSHRRSDSR